MEGEKEGLVINNTKDEIIVVVDEEDNVVGEANRKEMRQRNIPHRSTGILVLKQW
jgi:hypothetical protein